MSSKIAYQIAHYLMIRKQRTVPISDYRGYIWSDEWKVMGKYWLDVNNYRCQFFPFLKIGKRVKGRYRGYAIHHPDLKAYSKLGMEGKEDVLVLSKFAHECIFHGILAGGHWKGIFWKWNSSVTLQNKYGSKFPNCWQRAANTWCRLNNGLKIFLLMAVATASTLLLKSF